MYQSSGLMERRNPSTNKDKAPGRMPHSSRDAASQSQQPYKKLLQENASLKEQMRANEQSWFNEKRRLLNALTAARNSQRDSESHKKIEILEESLREQRNETERVKNHWLAEFRRINASWTVKNAQSKETWKERVKEIQNNFDKTLTEVNRDWENRFAAKQQEFESQLKLQDSGKKLSQVIQEKDALIKKVIDEKKALEKKTLECSAKLKRKEEELTIQSKSKHYALEGKLCELADKDKSLRRATQAIHRKDALIANLSTKLKALEAENKDISEKLYKKEEILQSTEWGTKLKALEDQLSCQLADKEKGFKRELDQSKKLSQLQEEVKLQIQQNTELQEAYKKVSQTILTMDALISTVKEEKAALEAKNAESSARLKEKEEEIFQSEVKLKALEDQLKCELASKEDSVREAQDLQRENKKMEEEWHDKMCQMEQEISLLKQRNTEFQKLADMTDKEKAKAKKEAKTAKKETEKKEKKEREETEKREKKERKETEKREKKEKKEREQKEKIEKKEEEEREKKEMKERKEKEKKEKKAKKETEKREKKERKETEKRENKEKKEREKKEKIEKKEEEEREKKELKERKEREKKERKEKEKKEKTEKKR